MNIQKALLGLSLLLALPLAAQESNYVSEVWCPDLGNGKYKNPVLYADYSDPDACRAENAVLHTEFKNVDLIPSSTLCRYCTPRI